MNHSGFIQSTSTDILQPVIYLFRDKQLKINIINSEPIIYRLLLSN